MEEDRYARIEDYLDNTLDEAGRTAFEADLKTDPALAEALARVSEARTRLARQWENEAADRALKNTLQEVNRQHVKSGAHHKSHTTPRFTLRRWWPAVAAAAALAGLLVWFLLPRGEADLYAQYRRFPEAAFTTRSTIDSAQAKLATAEAFFNKKQYSEALPLLQGQLDAQPDNLECRFYTGLCLLELGRLTEASAMFRRITTTENTWSAEARWYLALTYLKEKRSGECKKTLNQIKPDEAHYGEARELLEKISF